MLEDDGHLVGVKLAHARGEADAAGVGAEGDVEMMVADEPVARHVAEHLADDPAQRVLHENVVPDEIHRQSSLRRPADPAD